MGIGEWGRTVLKRLARRHGDVRSFEDDIRQRGGVVGRVDAGTRTVDTRKIVGSVGRAQNLRSDFFYKGLRPVTQRFRRVGEAMQGGIELPPLELYKVKRQPGATAPEGKGAPPPAPPSEYYVVDGHHRVAMARKLGQDFLDAHVVEYRVNEKTGGLEIGGPETGGSAADAPPSAQAPAAPAAGDPAAERSGGDPAGA